ncbi:MAG: chromosome segregation protein SMC [Lachnospiraceae bacterium]|nr:chromosome segregation protein SMC [Lachnospiraceae bacterium]
MYLKSIEVQGFKSFANKIKFDFHNGITGIVGPNGSGKSNVADAVRWVLGEQRIKQLRGGKMEDVIFAGTQNRKPLGFAYVAITLDNSDHKLAIEYDEVTVSRRLFRSGESEYMINGSICRLKDINELFYDTGIGKEGYSIIGQGQIDKILSGKPDERRELFDEAAGIVKFKRRKAEATKKLENEKDNLTRVIDILTELERQLKPLERQSETARKYLKLKEELKTYDINMFLLEITQIRASLSEIEKKYDIATNELEENRENLEAIKNQYEVLDGIIEEMNADIEDKKNLLNQTNIAIEKFDGDIKVINEQINSAKINDEHLKQRMNAIEEDIADHIKEKERLLGEKKEITEKLTEATKVQSEADGKIAAISGKIAQILEDIENSKSDIINLLNEKSGVMAKIQRYDTMLEQINIRKAELSQKLIKSKSDKEEQDKIIAELEEEFKRVNDEIIQYTTQAGEIEEKLSEYKKETAILIKEREDKQKKYHQISSNLEALKNMTERYEGYGNSIKKIMELKEREKGIVGVVADIIKVEKKYETAIETALGGNIQNVVTDTETTAKEAIEYLKRGKFGRATFLPLSSIANKTGFSNERVLTEKGVIGLACDLVQIKKEWENIAKYLLGRIVVADTIDNALLIARKYNYTLRIVTLDGELLNAGGSMSGGAFKNSSNLLGRRREIEELEKALEAIKSENQTINEKLNINETESRAANEELEKIKLVLNEQYILQNTVKMNMNKAGEKKQEIADSFEDLGKENAEIASQITDIKSNYDTLNVELMSFDDKNKLIEEKIASLNLQVEEQRKLEEEEIGKNQEMRLGYQSLKQKLEFIKENTEKLDVETNKLNEELTLIKSNAENATLTVLDRLKEIESIENSMKEAKQTKEQLEATITKLVADKDAQTKEHKDFITKREEISTHINELDKEIYRLSSQKEKLEEANEKQVNYMWDEYEITYSVALTMKNEELNNLAAIKKNISSLKSQIRDLGDVNVNSIEEYKNVSERYVFLKTQHDDLVLAAENLEKIIEELDTGMRNQFSEKFIEIKTEFDKVFKELFGGGKGTIELNEDMDILEADISIISQPPGKKLQNMMQLSGGEKALTAIALLFAIQNLKPSPFCLLDEIEAALDDSNVVRFAGYLHKLTDHTQFIVITHRRGTMAAADRLYGITMQEKGVSTLVSVNLLEAELQEQEDKS